MPAVGSRQQPIQCSSQLAPTDSTYEYSILNLILGSLVLLNSGPKMSVIYQAKPPSLAWLTLLKQHGIL